MQVRKATVRTGHGTTDWFQIGKGVRQGSILSPCLFNLHAEYIQIAYAIGIASPVSVMIDTFGTAVCDEEKISAAVSKLVDLRPAAIINKFDLRKPIYKELAAYGHMGREELGVKWEVCDIADELNALCLN